MKRYQGPSIHDPGAAQPEVHVELRFVWYQTVWSLATHYANGIPKKGGDARRAKGRGYAVVLAGTAYETLLILDGGLVDRDHVVRQRLTEFLRDTIQPSAITLTAGLSPTASAALGEDANLSDSELLRQMASDDEAGWSAAHRLVERYVLPNRWSPRTHYNLACYLVPDQNRRKEAIAQLKKAFDPDRSMPLELYLMADWAWEDNSLAALHDDPDFDKLTAPYRKSIEVEEWLRAHKP